MTEVELLEHMLANVKRGLPAGRGIFNRYMHPIADEHLAVIDLRGWRELSISKDSDTDNPTATMMGNEALINELWGSDQASALTNRAAREIERLNAELEFAPYAAVAAIEFALADDDCKAFLRCWNEGDFEAIRREWPEAPEEVFIGADPLYASTDKAHGDEPDAHR